MKEQLAGKFIIAAPEGTLTKVEAIVSSMGIEPDATCQTGAEAIEEAKGCRALVLTTYKLSDMTGAELAKELGDAADVLMIVPTDYEEETASGALLLHNPISQEALHQAIRATQHMQKKLTAAQAKAEKAERQLIERKTIDKAKGRLMDELHLTEKQAHYHIQKISMDQGRRLVDVAKELLEAQTLTEQAKEE